MPDPIRDRALALARGAKPDEGWHRSIGERVEHDRTADWAARALFSARAGARIRLEGALGRSVSGAIEHLCDPGPLEAIRRVGIDRFREVLLDLVDVDRVKALQAWLRPDPGFDARRRADKDLTLAQTPEPEQRVKDVARFEAALDEITPRALAQALPILLASITPEPRS